MDRRAFFRLAAASSLCLVPPVAAFRAPTREILPRQEEKNRAAVRGVEVLVVFVEYDVRANTSTYKVESVGPIPGWRGAFASGTFKANGPPFLSVGDRVYLEEGFIP